MASSIDQLAIKRENRNKLNCNLCSTMNTTGLNELIDTFNSLALEDKEYAADVINKQLVEAKRDALARRIKQAEGSLKKGSVKKGTLKALYEDLEND